MTYSPPLRSVTKLPSWRRAIPLTMERPHPCSGSPSPRLPPRLLDRSGGAGSKRFLTAIARQPPATATLTPTERSPSGRRDAALMALSMRFESTAHVSTAGSRRSAGTDASTSSETPSLSPSAALAASRASTAGFAQYDSPAGGTISAAAPRSSLARPVSPSPIARDVSRKRDESDLARALAPSDTSRARSRWALCADSCRSTSRSKTAAASLPSASSMPLSSGGFTAAQTRTHAAARYA